jgi:hypothetical protein
LSVCHLVSADLYEILRGCSLHQAVERRAFHDNLRRRGRTFVVKVKKITLRAVNVKQHETVVAKQHETVVAKEYLVQSVYYFVEHTIAFVSCIIRM